MTDNNLKIAMFGHKHIPSREGGIEVVVEELSTRMIQKGHSVICYNRKGKYVASELLDNKAEFKGVKIKSVFTINCKGLAAVTASFFAAISSSFSDVDVVHIHAEGPAFFSFIPKLIGKRVVVTIHGLDWARTKWGNLASWFIKAGERNAVKYADEIIVLSENVKEYFKDTYQRETKYISNGVNNPIMREPNAIKKWGLQKDDYILFLGRLVPEKGVHYLIKAAKGLNKKLVITGDGIDTKEYMNELKFLGENVIFTGFQQGNVLEELYSNAYIYCLPSDLEGMPLSLLEAMSYGNCCVVSSIFECVEVVEDKAVVFEKGNVEDLRSKLKWLIDNPDIVETYKRNSSEFICKKYSWDEVTNKTLGLYK